MLGIGIGTDVLILRLFLIMRGGVVPRGAIAGGGSCISMDRVSEGPINGTPDEMEA